MSLQLFDQVSYQTSKLVTRKYSTSFYLATTLLGNRIRNAIYGIYGFVRYADEIVDTFHQIDKEKTLNEFENEYYNSLERGLSLNPILHSFQDVVKRYSIDDKYVQAFLRSMKADLNKTEYTDIEQINEYIYGSADVVGLMCLSVFCEGNQEKFNQLKPAAMKLGSAFQKVNFLRDLKNDTEYLGRNYFPGVGRDNFDEESKRLIVEDIENDFRLAFEGIKKLPTNSRAAVLLAYFYYRTLLRKLAQTPASKIASTRIRISNPRKIWLMKKAVLVNSLRLI
ncbi:MAG: phytoene/squalene synthase family protein [Bacteroidales bacterium]|nr:phytoene/squalene synthase family protein [Bacteroidales bacterium]